MLSSGTAGAGVTGALIRQEIRGPYNERAPLVTAPMQVKLDPKT